MKRPFLCWPAPPSLVPSFAFNQRLHICDLFYSKDFLKEFCFRKSLCTDH
jgi:hypothetical protein